MLYETFNSLKIIQELLSNLQPSDCIPIISAFFGAFFAFCFFILGQFWISSLKEKKNNIAELEKIREYIVMQIYFFESNIQRYENIVRNIAPIGISINELKFFPIEENLLQRIGKFRVVESVIKFIVHLRGLNEDIRIFNRWMHELSEFSRIAMLEQREQDFSETMEKNVGEFKKEARKIYDHMVSTKEKIDNLLSEIDFTERCIRSFFWTKWYMNLRAYFDSKYRDKQIEQIQKKRVQNK